MFVKCQIMFPMCLYFLLFYNLKFNVIFICFIYVYVYRNIIVAVRWGCVRV
jgi:hypothetical protein